jgi:hypothetical protein
VKKHEPFFDEGCSKSLDQRKQSKLQWLQNPSKINGDNLYNVRYEANRHVRNKKDYLKDKIMSLGQTVRTKTSETCIEK